VTVATALLFGLAPALTAARVDISAQFQGGSRMLGSGRKSRLAQAMVVVQIALSLVLLVSTGLFVRTLNNLDGVGVGFNRHNLVLFRVDLTSAGYKPDQYAAVQSRLQERLEALPGVRSTTFSSVALLSGVRQNKRVTIPGLPLPAGGAPIVNTNGLAPNFFAAMELPIALGRGFTPRDDLSAPRVAVVNREFVRSYLDGGDPIGQVIVIGPAAADRVEIVGVSADAKYTQVRSATPATIYLPALQRVDGNANFAVRVSGTDAAAMASILGAVRGAVREIDPALPVLNLRTQDEQLGRLHAQEVLFARLSALFGVAAAVLAAIGLYGLMAHAVTRRTGEIGLRMALGALPRQVVSMIVRESLMLVGLGIGIGALAAYYSGQVVKTMMFGLSPSDPLTYAVVAVAILAVAIAAAVLPARRASRIDPTVALSGN
jgi:predicted permease